MRLTTYLTATSALVVSLAAAPLYAQDASKNPPNPQDTPSQPLADESTPASETNTRMNGTTGGSDPVVVTVGDAEILNSDVMRAIGMLPPAMRQQPADMLLPAAVQQLVLRELILDRAASENLADDPDFATMADQANAEAREDVTVQFWLQREMADAVNAETVNAAYEEIKQSINGEVPPLDVIRPQIEQELRRREMDRIRADLQTKGPEITFANQDQQQVDYSDGAFCTANYAPEGDTTQQAGSEFAEMDIDGDGMVTQEEYRQCRMAAAKK